MFLDSSKEFTKDCFTKDLYKIFGRNSLDNFKLNLIRKKSIVFVKEKSRVHRRISETF